MNGDAEATDDLDRPTAQGMPPRQNPADETTFKALSCGTKPLIGSSRTPKAKGTGKRLVVTEDMIIDVVEYVHVEESQHADWDATWKAISAKHSGVPRFDVLFSFCSSFGITPPKKLILAPKLSCYKHRQGSANTSSHQTST